MYHVSGCAARPWPEGWMGSAGRCALLLSIRGSVAVQLTVVPSVIGQLVCLLLLADRLVVVACRQMQLWLP